MKQGLWGISLVLAFTAGAVSAAENPYTAENCLDWKVEEHAAASDNSSCSFYNHEKVSTRFLVRNSCGGEVSGVFSYYKSDTSHRPVLNIRPFAVKPGDVVEVANPCDLSIENGYQVSRVSFNDTEV